MGVVVVWPDALAQTWSDVGQHIGRVELVAVFLGVASCPPAFWGRGFTWSEENSNALTALVHGGASGNCHLDVWGAATRHRVWALAQSRRW